MRQLRSRDGAYYVTNLLVETAMNLTKTKRMPGTDPGSRGWRGIGSGDLMVAAQLSTLAIMSWVLPVRYWPYWCNRIARVSARLFPARNDSFVEHVSRITGKRLPPESLGGLWIDRVSAILGENMQLLRLHASPGTDFGATVHGEGNLQRALTREKGVILWVGNFVYSSLITKMALQAHGVPIHHLSRPTHGFSSTPFAIRFLNPIKIKIETRYLKERIVIEPGAGKAAMSRMKAVLLQNGVVSIVATPEARQLSSRPFLDGTADLAAGAIKLAYETGAAIVPVFTLPNRRGGFTTRLEQPIYCDTSQDFKTVLPQVMDDYLERSETHVLDHPALWQCWDRGTTCRLEPDPEA